MQQCRFCDKCFQDKKYASFCSKRLNVLLFKCSFLQLSGLILHGIEYSNEAKNDLSAKICASSIFIDIGVTRFSSIFETFGLEIPKRSK